MSIRGDIERLHTVLCKFCVQVWAKEWSLGLEYVSFVKLRHS